ncbi:MAG TPA: barstar family protein [Terriglobales bacterium]|nr:barstar family protein [Terriglobales bacterium]
MSPKAVYEIDGDRFSMLEEFYDEISQVLIPGSYWGRNLEAFNDILRGGLGTPEGGFVLVWKNSQLSRERLGYSEAVRQLRKQLETCHPSNRERITRELDEARHGRGPTVFDELLEIISIHALGGSEERDGVELVLK